jgi:hypothetical protein
MVIGSISAEEFLGIKDIIILSSSFSFYSPLFSFQLSDEKIAIDPYSGTASSTLRLSRRESPSIMAQGKAKGATAAASHGYEFGGP